MLKIKNKTFSKIWQKVKIYFLPISINLFLDLTEIPTKEN
jgi:hypothetical protein